MESQKLLISIDVFDTAIFRSVFFPTDIFKVIENKVGNNFCNLRIEAQKQATKRNPNFNIIDIYSFLPKKFSMKDEIFEEIRGAKANEYILDFYKENKDKYDLIFISDMYLPSKVLTALLEHVGYKNPKVFVSCEEGCTKSGGKLFLKVQEKLRRKISKHIGDNYNADIKGAKAAQIPEVEFVGSPIYSKSVVTPVLKNPVLRKLMIDNEFKKDVSVGEKIGFLFAPLALLFTQSILAKVPQNKTIFFNARDSFLMYIIARWILKTDKKIKYCRFTRKSAHLPYFKTNLSIQDERNRKSFSFLVNAKVNSLQDFKDSFDIENVIDYEDLLEKYKIRIDTDLAFDARKYQILKEFVILNQESIYKKAREEKKNLLRYLERLGMKNGDVFVDLGHVGSMQSILQEITGIKLQGEYIHLYPDYKKFFKDDAIKNSFLPNGYLRSCVGIVEAVFTELKGTVIKYDKDGNPVLNLDTKYRKDYTKSLLRGVLSGVKTIVENKIDLYFEDCLTLLKRFLETPTLEEASYANKEIFENGSFSANESIAWYNRDLIRTGRVRECYGRSYWKPAFKVLLKNDLDYNFLLKELS